MELTDSQNEYINNLVSDWNLLISNKTPKDFVNDELGLAVVTSTSALVVEQMQQYSDPDAAKIWGLIILGAFLHSERLLQIGENTLQ